MKLTIILISILLFSCQSQPSTAFKPSPSDTARTMALYRIGNTYQYRQDVVIRISKDSFAFTKVDSTATAITQIKSWRRDTLYYIPLPDTAKKEGKAVLDSLGKPVVRIHYYLLPAQFIIHDFNKY
ncbi:MAG: hypothetical protein ACTHKV_00880 [Flavipsychrobacter sp.]